MDETQLVYLMTSVSAFCRHGNHFMSEDNKINSVLIKYGINDRTEVLMTLHFAMHSKRYSVVHTDECFDIPS